MTTVPTAASSTASIDLPVPRIALAIGAHPDDVEFWCGATLSRWAAAGCVVHHLICTDGSKGTWDPSADIEHLIATRQVEQRAAAAELGATGEVVFLGETDGDLVAARPLVSAIAREIRRLQPEVVFGHDPWKRYRLHPDHRNAGFLTVDAVVAARDPHFFPEHGLPHHRPQSLMLFEADEANHLEVAEPRWLERKLAALEAHRSQLETTHFYALDDGPGAIDPLAGFRERETQKLAEAAAPFDRAMGEAFHLIAEL